MMKYRKLTWIIILTGLVFFLILLAPMSIGVWVPDILSGKRHVLAEVNMTDRTTLRVIQYWNHSDFYTTELQHWKNGDIIGQLVLDGDDAKQWSVELQLEDRDATVVWKDGRTRKESLPLPKPRDFVLM